MDTTVIGFAHSAGKGEHRPNGLLGMAFANAWTDLILQMISQRIRKLRSRVRLLRLKQGITNGGEN